MSIGEGHEDHFVSTARIAVSGAMLADKDAAPVALGQELAAVERKPERSGVGAEPVVGNDSLGDEVRPRRLHARSEVVAE